ncbi:recombination mediator RecR [Truepera radiovictrix]|nr:recombination mediator RecR [Truepera radiovictrix]WMT55964.1 recombination mediator RecR [Truepera radiovictrix]
MTQLIRELGRLPGIGPKSAQRLAFYLFNQPEEDVKSLAEALLNAKGNLRQCERCFNITDQEVCSVCRDPGREQGLICVVEAPADLLAIERSGEYSGLYHVLHGALSPMNGVGPDQLTIQPLLARLGGVREVILATATTVEGEATAMYLARLLGELKVPTSRIAYGLPVGGDLEYADEVTLGRAISNRRPL